MSDKLTRRSFLATASAGSAVTLIKSGHASTGVTILPSSVDAQPAVMGGPAVRSGPFPSWPVLGQNDRDRWPEILASKKWNRGPNVDQFEKVWAETLGTRYVVATASGTAALAAALFALDVGPGDEVILPPYTFVATLNVVLMRYALPIFVDSDRETFQIDADKIEAAITDRTRCIMPVHLGGNVANMDKILEVGKQSRVPVLEDACQAHLAEWNGKKVGSVGRIGCFSFQATKNLNCGEGGAISSSDAALMMKCYSFHNAGRPYALSESGDLKVDPNSEFGYVNTGDNRRMTEFQAAVLLGQKVRLEEQASTREQNAEYLSAQLKEIPGIKPAVQYPNCTRNAYHLYMFRYDPASFSGLTRDLFIKAMNAEGIPCSSGYKPLNKEYFLKTTLESRGFRKIYGTQLADKLAERNDCPENDKLCEEAVWMGQNVLLGSRADMDTIVAAVAKIHRHSGKLV